MTEIHGYIADRVPGEPTVRATARLPALQRKGAAGSCVEGVFDPLADEFVLAVDAVQVDLAFGADRAYCATARLVAIDEGGSEETGAECCRRERPR